MTLTLADIENLIKFVSTHKLDSLEFEGLRITKTKHEQVLAEKPANKLLSKEAPQDLDEVLFWSTSTPSLTQEQINELAANPAPPPGAKRVRKTKDQS